MVSWYYFIVDNIIKWLFCFLVICLIIISNVVMRLLIDFYYRSVNTIDGIQITN